MAGDRAPQRRAAGLAFNGSLLLSALSMLLMGWWLTAIVLALIAAALDLRARFRPTPDHELT